MWGLWGDDLKMESKEVLLRVELIDDGLEGNNECSTKVE